MIDIKSLKSLKSFDWRSLRKLANPRAADDLNAFLEKLPQHAGQTMLIIAAVAWAAAGGLGLYTTVQLQSLTKLRAELQEIEALKPIVPTIQDVAVSGDEVQKVVEQMSQIYKGLVIDASGSAITIAAKSTAGFAEFREAVGHVQNGGSGWRVSVDHLCVGRECGKEPLMATLRINKVSVQKPG